MKNIEKHNLTLLEFENLSRFSEITHFVSTRKGGVSGGAYAELNISFTVGDFVRDVSTNRKRLAEALGIQPRRFVFQNQQHSAKVQNADFSDCKDFTRHTYSFEGSDALITNRPGICLFVFAADCVPILVVDKENKAIAAVHSGWRGTSKKILKHTLEKMRREFESKPENIFAGIGPAISLPNYEVGSRVAHAFQQAYGAAADKFIAIPKGKKEHLDLYAANKYLLTEHGVPDSHIEISDHCTFRDKELLFSARRKAASGRFGAGIMLNA